MAYLSGYTKRDEYVIQSSKVSAGVTDFPVYVNLADLSADFWSNVKSDGADIRVTRSDETTECAIEVVDIDTTAETGELHFKANTISSSANTTFYIYYGDATATAYGNTDTYGRNNVWSDYERVYHMQEDPSGTAPQIIDSSGNNDATSGGSMTSGDSVAGKLSGNCLDFDGTDDYLDTNWTGFQSDHSITMWVRGDTGANGRVSGSLDRSPISFNAEIIVDAAKEVLFRYRIGDWTRVENLDEPGENTWGHIAATADVSGTSMTIDLFSNSSNAATTDESTGSGADPTQLSTQFPVWIAALNDEGGWNNGWDGRIDEFRIRSSVLSADWITTEYNNQDDHSTWAVVTAESSGGGGGGPAIIAARRAIFFGI